MIINGRSIAEDIIKTLEQERAHFGALTLGVVMVAGDKATDSFVKIKTRVAQRLGVEVRSFGPDEMPQALRCDGVIVQLPIPNAEALLAALPPEKDVDGIGTMGEPRVLPPVAAAIAEVLARSGVEVRGKKVLIVGHGNLVGKPIEAWFKKQLVSPSVVTDSINLARQSKDADIIILGVGEPGLLRPDMIKSGAVVVDAGTSESGGKLAGDADPRCAEVASVFTPVPGGIGPIAVAMIFKNLFELKKSSGN